MNRIQVGKGVRVIGLELSDVILVFQSKLKVTHVQSTICCINDRVKSLYKHRI